MLKIVLLILLLVFSANFAQAQIQKQIENEPVKLFEYENINDENLKEKIKEFDEKLKSNIDSQGCIFLYGTSVEIKKRRRQLLKFLYLGDVKDNDGARITFIDIESEKKSLTVLWIVPPGAELPKPEENEHITNRPE